jgi:probable phosphoglycerate mutase
MNKNMHLYLIRHGQSHMNTKEYVAAKGYGNVGLTPKGERQAELLARWLPTVLPAIDALYCSTMLRARETVAPLAQVYGCEVIFDDRLREIGNNRLDHTPWDDEQLPTRWADYWYSERPFSPVAPIVEGGETMMHFRARVGMLLEDLVARHRGQTVVLVCHGGVVEATFDHVFNTGPWRRCEVWDRNTAVTHFEYVEHPRREVWRLHFHNREEHLRDLDM